MEKQDLKDFLNASRDQLPKEERHNVVRGYSKSSENGAAALKDGVGEIFDADLTRERLDAFIDFISKKGEIIPTELVPLGNLLRNFGSRSETGDYLNEKEKNIVSIAVKYFEGWMLKGGFIDSPKYNDEEGKLYDYHAVACFLVNQLAKIKEVRENEGIANFNEDKIKSLFNSVDKFIEEEVLSEKKDKEYTTTLVRLSGERDKIDAEIFKNAEESGSVVKQARIFVTQELARKLNTDEKNISINSSQIVKMLKGQSFIGAHRGTPEFAYHNEFDFSSVDFSLPEEMQHSYDVLDKKKKELEKEKGEKEDGLEKTKKRLDTRKKIQKKVLRETTLKSKQGLVQTLEKKGGDLYLLKTLTIAGEILRRKVDDELEEDLTMPEYHTDRFGPIFDFETAGYSVGAATFRQVHYIPEHLLYAYLTSLYFKSQKSKK